MIVKFELVMCWLDIAMSFRQLTYLLAIALWLISKLKIKTSYLFLACDIKKEGKKGASFGGREVKERFMLYVLSNL